EDVEELSHAGRVAEPDDVVAEEDPERLVADERARAQDGVAEAERLLLPDVTHRGQLRDRLDLNRLLHLPAVIQVLLELAGGIEVVLDRTLVPSRHDDDLAQAGGDRFLDDVLDRRFVDERQHLLGLGFGGGKEARAEAGGGKHTLAYCHETPFTSII